MATESQISYCNVLLERHDERETLGEMICDINPPLTETMDFEEWFAELPVSEASVVIQQLKDGLDQ